MKNSKQQKTEGEIYDLYNGLKKMKSYANSNLSMAKHRTINFLYPIANAIQKTMDEAQATGQAHDKELHEYLVSVCEKVNGMPNIIDLKNGLYNYKILPEKLQEANEKQVELKEKHKDILEKREAMIKGLDKIKKRKAEVVICKIKYDDAIAALNIDDDMQYAIELFEFKHEGEEEGDESKKIKLKRHN